MLCIGYVIAVGMLLGGFALLVERALPQGWPRRWIWCLVMPVAVFLPGYYRWHHNWSVVSALEGPRRGLSTADAMGMGSFALFDPAWWSRTSAYDSTINRSWLVASAVLILWGLAQSWRVWRLVRLASRRNQVRRPLVVDGVPVVLTDLIGPATAGLVRSRVLVPKWVLGLPATDRHYIVRHEEEHRRAHDAQLLFVASLPLILMPWNLAYWWLLRRLSAAVEMDCDNRVVGASAGRMLMASCSCGWRRRAAVDRASSPRFWASERSSGDSPHWWRRRPSVNFSGSSCRRWRWDYWCSRCRCPIQCCGRDRMSTRRRPQQQSIP